MKAICINPYGSTSTSQNGFNFNKGDMAYIEDRDSEYYNVYADSEYKQFIEASLKTRWKIKGEENENREE